MLKRSLFLAALIVLLSSAVRSQSPVAKSPEKARLYSLVVPSTGHIYAGEWLTGLYWLGGESALITGGFAVHNGMNSDNKKWIAGSMWMGALLVHLCGMEHAALTVEKHNKVSVNGGFDGASGFVRFSYNF